ncbi:MAG: hypothetical protein ACP5XB_08720 [Isosphaeraceae bacterium]
MISQRNPEAHERNGHIRISLNGEKALDIVQLEPSTLAIPIRAVMPEAPYAPADLDERVQTWTREWQPRSSVEAELVARAAKLSWTLEQAEQAETARSTTPPRVKKPAEDASPQAFREFRELCWRLFNPPEPEKKHRGAAGRPALPFDDPAVYVYELEQTARGCRWLLERWHEFRHLLGHRVRLQPSDLFRFVRLLGKQEVEAVNDQSLSAIFLAWNVLWPNAGNAFWSFSNEQMRERGGGVNALMSWREITDQPCDEDEAWSLFRRVVEEQIDRLMTLLAGHEEQALIEPVEPAPDQERERDRRRRESLGRELLRTVEALRKLRDVKSDKRIVSDNTQPSAAAPPELDSPEVDPHEVVPRRDSDTNGNRARAATAVCHANEEGNNPIRSNSLTAALRADGSPRNLCKTGEPRNAGKAREKGRSRGKVAWQKSCGRR